MSGVFLLTSIPAPAVVMVSRSYPRDDPVPGPGIDREGGGRGGRFFHRNPPPTFPQPPPLISADSLSIRGLSQQDGRLPGPVRDGFDVGGHGEHPLWEQIWPTEDRFPCGARRNPAGECSSLVQRRLDGPAGHAGNRPRTRYGNRNPAAGTPERQISVSCQGVRRKKPE